VRAKGGAFAEGRRCAHPDCTEPGDYRAPLARPGSALAGPSGPPRWQYFCLTHVREFNARWDYFAGMDADAIFAAQTPYPSWDRETRAFAHNAFGSGPDRVEDALGVLRWKAETRPPAARLLSREDRQALARLGLPETATLAEVKAAYRKLARRYHPDANGGDRRHEAKVGEFAEAQAHLMQSATFRRASEASRG